MPRLNHARRHGNRPSDNLRAQLTRNIVKWNYNMPLTPIASHFGVSGPSEAMGIRRRDRKREVSPLLGDKEIDAGGHVYHIAAVDVNRALGFSSQ